MYSSSTTGERQISAFTVFGSKVYSGSVIPPQTSCEIGSGRSYALDLYAASGTSTTSDVGILGEPFVIAVGSDALTKTTGRSGGAHDHRAHRAAGSGALKNSAGTTAVATVFHELAPDQQLSGTEGCAMTRAWTARRGRPRGFTLIELMITVAIVAIPRRDRHPAYQDSVIRAKRARRPRGAWSTSCSSRSLYGRRPAPTSR